MRVLLSIKPEFADKIFSGEKKYEFRRSIFKNQSVKKIIVYASSPVQKVIGEFEIESILDGTPTWLWEQTWKHAGISEDFFFAYFKEKENGYAIKVTKVFKYKEPLCLKKAFKLSPPQSFAYIS